MIGAVRGGSDYELRRRVVSTNERAGEGPWRRRGVGGSGSE